VGFVQKALSPGKTNLGQTRFGVTLVNWDARANEKEKSCFAKSKTKEVKQMVGSMVQHMQDFKRSLAMNVQKEEDEEKMPAMKEIRIQN
jgi:hypothetical protein